MVLATPWIPQKAFGNIHSGSPHQDPIWAVMRMQRQAGWLNDKDYILLSQILQSVSHCVLADYIMTRS